MAKIVFGCGYLGQVVAQLWRSAGDEVYAITRSSERAKQLRQNGLQPIVADLTEGLVLPADLQVDTALFAVGFDRGREHSIRDVYVGGLRRALDALPPSHGTLIYISSTGVYGQTNGETVDETTPCRPQRDGGKACLEAEELLAEHPWGERRVILRLAGIYGPGRIPKLAAVRKGEPLEVHPNSVLNLIHRDDAAAIVLAAEQRAQPPTLYVVSDGQPVLRRDFYSTLAELLQAPDPVFSMPNSSQGGPRRSVSDKRIKNQRMCDDLAVHLLYPSYRDGLRAIVQGLAAG